MTTTTNTYSVTIQREQFQGRDCWVARDENGDWRTYCDAHFADSAAGAVAMMFHVCEVESVTDLGETASAVICCG
jgi:hypothetical protein